MRVAPKWPPSLPELLRTSHRPRSNTNASTTAPVSMHAGMHRVPTPPRGTATTPPRAAWWGQHTLLDGVLVLTCTRSRPCATARLALVDTPRPRSSVHARPCSEASTSAASDATIASTRSCSASQQRLLQQMPRGVVSARSAAPPIGGGAATRAVRTARGRSRAYQGNEDYIATRCRSVCPLLSSGANGLSTLSQAGDTCYAELSTRAS